MAITTCFRRGSIRAVGIVLSAFMLSFLLAGCGNSSSGQAHNAGAPTFATAEEVLTYYNDITYHVDVIDMRNLVQIMYCESAFQEQLVRIYEKSIPYVELDQRCWELYGTGLTPTPYAPLAGRISPAVFVENGPDRALARGETPDGETEDLYFVRIGERWWLSGYTLEKEPTADWESMDLAKMEEALEYMSSVAVKLERDVRYDTYGWQQHGEDAIGLVRQKLLAYLVTEHPELKGKSDLFDWSR